MAINNIVLLENVPIVGGQPDASVPATQSGTSTQSTGNQVAAEEQAGGAFGGFGLTTILLYAGLIAALYFFMIRPQKKREKQIKEMQEGLKVGDNIITTAGMYGTIASIGDDCFVVEFGTNKGVRIPIRKIDVAGVKTPSLSPATKDLE